MFKIEIEKAKSPSNRSDEVISIIGVPEGTKRLDICLPVVVLRTETETRTYYEEGIGDQKQLKIVYRKKI